MAEITHVSAEQLGLHNMDGTGYKSIYQVYIKRCADIMISMTVAPFVALIAIPIGIAIKLEDHGPIIYRSKRIGKEYHIFDMFKFRSMSINAPNILNSDGSTYNAEDDPRVTKVGHFIRETSIDELPQIFNVLLGQMSIIGPRAGDTDGIGTYSDAEKDKMLVRPGITGYTQAYFRNGLGVSEKRIYDAWYAHNVSFGLDVKIFFKTIATVLKRENLYTN